MTSDGGDGWSNATRTVAQRTASADVQAARRGVASFGGGGGPGPGARVREFIRRYGWRAYALPLLLVVTVVALLTTGDGGSPRKADAARPPALSPSTAHASSPPVAPSSIPLKSDVSPGAGYPAVLKNGELPTGGPYTKAGDATFTVISGTSKPVGTPGGRLYRYDIEYERGITGINFPHYAAMVQATLDDPRSWSGHGVRVQRVDSGEVDFHVTLTSSMTVRQFCGYDIPVETSCYAAADSVAGLYVNRVVFNDARWVRGATPYIGDLNAYRIYMINHEDGHAMGHEHAHQCLPGGLAPVMMQQTFGLKSAANGQLCGANPWPYPPGAKGAPGAEQPDTPQNNEYNLGD